jgi:hypothetical protein
MKLHEIVNEKEHVDEWGIPAAVASAGATAVRLAPTLVKYGKKAYDYGKKALPFLKKAKGALHGIGSKVHAGTEIVKKGIKRSPPTHGDGSELAKTDMVPGPQAYHKNKAVAVARPALPQGKLSPEADAAIAQVQQARFQKKRQRP